MKNINVFGRKQRKILDICQPPSTLLYSVLWQVESIASFSTWCPLLTSLLHILQRVQQTLLGEFFGPYYDSSLNAIQGRTPFMHIWKLVGIHNSYGYNRPVDSKTGITKEHSPKREKTGSKEKAKAHERTKRERFYRPRKRYPLQTRPAKNDQWEGENRG
ncbi:bicyclomycin resistance protein [Aspergillus luchuensis]|uniref:Bicyclomycin resistance protein n=1 Tax=Aspergillus kawachii TaxID=1069201 RepID=A0A146FUL4_ASPKA|nr:bicyclomycin resistance protein [Aspergillus luchuensis]